LSEYEAIAIQISSYAFECRFYYENISMAYLPLP